MTEKSAVDTLNEIHEMLTSLTARVALMEQNINLLHGKANGALFPDFRLAAKPSSQNPPPATDHIQDLAESQKIPGVPLPSPNARVHGKIHSADRKPMHGVSVIIKNAKNETVKQTKTNMAGEWMAHLPSGKYALTYTKPMMSPIYRLVTVDDGQQDVEVI